MVLPPPTMHFLSVGFTPLKVKDFVIRKINYHFCYYVCDCHLHYYHIPNFVEKKRVSGSCKLGVELAIKTTTIALWS